MICYMHTWKGLLSEDCLLCLISSQCPHCLCVSRLGRPLSLPPPWPGSEDFITGSQGCELSE